MTGKFKVSIDRKGCISCGTCWNTCPELFEQNPADTYSQVVEKYRTDIDKGEAPERFGNLIRRAAQLCPVQVIHIG